LVRFLASAFLHEFDGVDYAGIIDSCAISELFNAADLERLHTAFDVVWGRDEPISEADFKHHWPSVSALVSCTPEVDSNMLSENWLADNTQTDFTLRGASIGFIGFGQIAQALSRLLVPFNPRMKAYDPWLSDDVASDHQVELSDFDEVLAPKP